MLDILEFSRAHSTNFVTDDLEKYEKLQLPEQPSLMRRTSENIKIQCPLASTGTHLVI